MIWLEEKKKLRMGNKYFMFLNF